jgi:hypothetical protein
MGGAVTDWTIILTSVGAAAVSGGFGYAAARATTKASLRQVEGENERLRAQHREDHLRNRQGTYHHFLNVDRRFTSLLLRGETSQDSFNEWHDAAMGILLFGSAGARQATERLTDEVAEMFKVARARVGGIEPLGTADVLTAWVEREEAINGAKARLLEAMRDDVAPAGVARDEGAVRER